MSSNPVTKKAYYKEYIYQRMFMTINKRPSKINMYQKEGM